MLPKSTFVGCLLCPLCLQLSSVFISSVVMPLYKRSTGDAVPCRVLDENPDGTLNIEYLRNRKLICFDRVAAHKVTDVKFEVPYEELPAVHVKERAVTSDGRTRADLHPTFSPLADDSDTVDELDPTQIADSDSDEEDESSDSSDSDSSDSSDSSDDGPPQAKRPCVNRSFVCLNSDRVKAAKLARQTNNSKACEVYFVPLTTLKRWKKKGALYAKAKPTKRTLHYGKKAKYAVAESLTAKWIRQRRVAGCIVTKQ